MAPAILNQARSLLADLAGRNPVGGPDSAATSLSALGPFAAGAILHSRDDAKTPSAAPPPSGVIEPHNMNNNAVFAIFGVVGAAFVVVGIWFFFWARNGGFYFKQTDWDDYKSTVLRRKGPNGTTLSGATPSTDLGGGSVYKDIDDGTTVVTDSTRRAGGDDKTEVSAITGGVSDVSGRDRRRRRREAKEREKERRRAEKEEGRGGGGGERKLRRHRRGENEEEDYEDGEGEGDIGDATRGGGGRHANSNNNNNNNKHRSGRRVGVDGLLVDDEAAEEAEEHLRAYQHERPARVGGLNKKSDASAWGTSSSGAPSGAGGDGSTTAASSQGPTADLLANRETTPTNTPTKSGGGIRKVYSAADRTADREAERVRAEARRLQEKGRAAGAGGAANLRGGGEGSGGGRRDFSFQRAEDPRGNGGGGGGHRSGQRRIEGDGSSAAGLTESYVPGAWTESEVGSSSGGAGRGGAADTASDVGTKTYHHTIPGLSSASGSGSGQDYAEEKRKKRAADRGAASGGASGWGYRRG